MRFPGFRYWLATIPAALLACGSDGGVTPGPPATPVWSEITNLPSPITLYALWAPRNDLVIGVGRAGNIWQWDGQHWTQLARPSAEDLFSIDGNDTGGPVAVGDRGVVLEQKQGVFVPVDALTRENLRGVWRSDSDLIVAVGGNGIIIRRTGPTWSTDTTPTSASLLGVWGAGDSDIFAVGVDGTILHNNGTAWSVMPSQTTEILSAISGTSPADVYAVGSAGTILHYDGLAWASMPGGTETLLQSVCATCGPAAVGANGLVLRMVDGKWTRETIAGAPWLYAITRATNSQWAAGAHAILRHDGTQWLNETRGTVPFLRSVAFSPETGLVAAGDDGVVMTGGPRRWRYEDAGALSRLNSVWVSPSGEVFAAGINHIFRRTDTGWVAENTELVEYFDVGGDEHHVFAVGSDGAIRERRGAAWTVSRFVTPQDLHAVRMSGAGSYVAGAGGTILEFDGANWRLEYTRSNAVLWDVAAVQTSRWRALAVGENGLCIGLSAFDGSGWNTVPTHVPGPLYGLARGPEDHLFAVGASGTVLRFIDEQWSVVPAPLPPTHRGVCSRNGAALFVCGGDLSFGGTLFRYGPPGP